MFLGKEGTRARLKMAEQDLCSMSMRERHHRCRYRLLLHIGRFESALGMGKGIARIFLRHCGFSAIELLKGEQSRLNVMFFVDPNASSILTNLNLTNKFECEKVFVISDCFDSSQIHSCRFIRLYLNV